ncbi:Fungalysin metallopeptidase-domain-containing protein [Mycena metata]|uniref:Extracellular metalloproteinase n=1 Tax=Mycena metata TaxID=1033252 RepID=A0AAD7IVU2_9AGAR|nr:Fungalysin metallopeptidase-domain-containing protein [Mycena metata]
MSLASLTVFLGLLSWAAARTLKATLRTPSTQKFFPPNSFQTFEGGVDHLSRRDDASLADSATAYVQAQLQVNSSSVAFKSGYASDIVQYAYVKQHMQDNIPFANSVANVAFTDGKWFHSGIPSPNPNVTLNRHLASIASSTPSISVDAAVAAAEKALNGTYNIPATLEYLVNADNTASLVHVVQIRNKKNRVWVEAFVDAHSGQLLSTIDLYRVLPVDKQDLTDGFETVTDPQNLTASPLGGTTTGPHRSPTPRNGNNVVAFYNELQSATTNQSAPGLVFNYTQDPSLEPAQGMNIDASVTNVFYVTNTIHDVSYRYGFTEAAFNFQQTNTQAGGVAGDPILAFVQSDQGFDNAGFATPPESDSLHPMRDSGLENDIITHELFHGVTGRLIRGHHQSIYLLIAFGLGEVWANILHFPDQDLRPPERPIRSGQTSSGVRGEAYQTLSGSIMTARTDPSGPEGNIVFLYLFIDSLSLLPCQPDTLQARDGIIQADQNRYAGANKCVLWKAFASRGLGFKAVDYTDDFTVPSDSGC